MDYRKDASMTNTLTLGIVIPTVGLHNVTHGCIERFAGNLLHPKQTQVIIVDNLYNSQNLSALEEELKQFAEGSCIVRNTNNLGYWDSLIAGIKLLHTDLALCMHNDVYIYEQDFDQRIINEFLINDKLGIAGFFGGRGLSIDGGRGHPESNMVGRYDGTHGSLHGAILKESHPAVVFDSLAMIFRVKYLLSVDYTNLPPHHWCDRLICLRMMKAGFNLLTIGIEFDHGGSYTSNATYNGESLLESFSREWCTSKGLPRLENWNHTLYMYGLNMFQQEYRAFVGNDQPIWVRKHSFYDWKHVYYQLHWYQDIADGMITADKLDRKD